MLSVYEYTFQNQNEKPKEVKKTKRKAKREAQKEMLIKAKEIFETHLRYRGEHDYHEQLDGNGNILFIFS